MSKVKRAKITHPEPIQASEYKDDAPKTSEYAFFKRLKKDFGGVNSRQRYKEADQLKIINANSHAKTSTNFNKVNYMDGNLRSSSRAERGGPTSECSLLTTIGVQSDKFGAGANKDIFREINQRASLFSRIDTHVGGNVFPSPFSGAAKNLGNQYAEKGVFSAKRQKLHQLVANTFPEVGEFSSNRFDVVSMLLSRLFPRGNETEIYQYLDSKEGIIDGHHQSPDFPEPGPLEKTSTQNAAKFQDGSYWNNAFPEYESGTPREVVLSKWDMTASDFPLTKNDAETAFHDEDAICGFDGETIKSLCKEYDSSPCLLFEKCWFTGHNHPKQLAEIYEPYEPGMREPCTLFLSWDVKEEKEKNLYSTLATSFDVAHKPIMDNTFEAISMRSSSLYLNNDLDYYSCPFLHSSYAPMHDQRRRHEDDCNVAEVNQFHLGLLSPRKYLSMGDDCNTYNNLKNNTVNVISGDHPWYSGKVSGNDGEFEALRFSRGLSVDLGWKCLPMGEFYTKYSSNYGIFQFPFRKDLHAALQDEESWLYCSKPRETTLAFYDSKPDIIDWSSANFHMCTDKVMGHSLLLDYPGMLRSQEELDFEDDKN